MSNAVSVRVVRDDISKFLAKLKTADKIFDAWAARELPRIYSNAQRMRWASEGNSEGTSWVPPMNAGYRKWKEKTFAGWAGSGRKTSIASSRLLAGILPPGEREGIFLGPVPEGTRGRSTRSATYWREMRNYWGKEFRAVQGNGIVQYLTAVPYAREVSERNELFKFGKATREQMANSFGKYLVAAARKRD